MENKKFTRLDKVVMAIFPFQQFIYMSDDGKFAELLSEAGTIHYRQLDFLELQEAKTSGILSGVIGVITSPNFGNAK